jgi:hypothetical protein
MPVGFLVERPVHLLFEQREDSQALSYRGEIAINNDNLLSPPFSFAWH